ncbi:MAG: DUF1232 domain-containing protein [Bacteroidota bacterium]
MAKPTGLTRYYKQATDYLSNPKKIKRLLAAVGSYTQKYPIEVKSFLKDLKLLLEILKAWYSGKYTTIPTKTLILIIVALVYLITPIDLIPDFLPGGLIDDAAVIMWVLKSIGEDIKKYKLWKKRKKK